jgi:hypothetical protein
MNEPREESDGAARIADAVAEDAYEVLVRAHVPEENVREQAEEIRKALRAAAEARAFYRGHNRKRAEMLDILRTQQGMLLTEDVRQEFGRIIERIAQATYLTGGDS